MQNKVIFRFSDIDLATYLICKGCQYKEVQVSFNKRYAEYKIFICIEGNKELMTSVQKDFNKSKKLARQIENFNMTKEFILSQVSQKVKEN
jgi:C4-type Zn-finger protein